MLAEPIPEEFIRDSQLSSGILNSFKVNRRKPRIVNLLWHFPLDMSQGVLPDSCASHYFCIILHTQAYSYLWITWFFGLALRLRSQLFHLAGEFIQGL